MYLLGIDTGGTTSECVVVDEKRRPLGIGDAGPGNYRVAGPDGARDHIECAITEALEDAGINPTSNLVGGFGMGTLDTDHDREVITGFLDDIHCIDQYYVTNDVVAAYYAFSAGGPGVVVIAGTGSMAFGRNEAGDEARSSGWGWLFGDEGSGFDTARRGLRAASKAFDGRGAETALERAACEHFELGSFEDVFTGVLDEIEHAKEIASFAKPVAETAAAGDPVATNVVETAADELAEAAAAVIDQLGIEATPLVSLQGGFGSADVVSSHFRDSIRSRYPDTRFATAVRNPVVGSIAFASLKQGNRVTRAELASLDDSITSLR